MTKKKSKLVRDPIIMSVQLKVASWLISNQYPMALDSEGIPGRCTVSVSGEPEGIWFFERMFPHINIDEVGDNQNIPSFGYYLTFNDDGDKKEMRLCFYHVKSEAFAADLGRKLKSLTSKYVQVQLMDTMKVFNIPASDYQILRHI